MNSHTVGATAVRKLPAMTNISDMRARIKSLFKGPTLRLFASTHDPAGNITRSTTAAVMLLTVEMYVAYATCYSKTLSRCKEATYR